ncbi:MAG: Wzz/FepE/Etk N-terminal domain-containing protein [Thermodesulfobacteriota bacterium]|nr:Wzz/FepE/Etk N-terminal domain-containing protein [Thermodesulfobacteriota bacterium]
MNTNERLPDICEDEIDLWAYLGVLWKRKVLILSITLLCAISAAVISLLLPKSYRSELILSVGCIGNMGSIDDVNNVAAQIKSRPFLATVIQKNGLKPKHLNINASVERNTNLINVQTEAESPEQAVAIVNAVANEVVERHKVRFDEAMRVARDIEADLNVRIAASEAEIRVLRENLAKIQRNPKIDVPAVILFTANLNDRGNNLGTLKQRLGEVRLANSPLRSENTRVVDPAILPEGSARPKTFRVVSLGTFSGFMIGVFGAFIQESFARRKKANE